MSDLGSTQNGRNKQRDGQRMSTREKSPPDIPAWTALLTGVVVLGVVAAALIRAEDKRTHTLVGFLQNFWSERE